MIQQWMCGSKITVSKSTILFCIVTAGLSPRSTVNEGSFYGPSKLKVLYIFFLDSLNYVILQDICWIEYICIKLQIPHWKNI